MPEDAQDIQAQLVAAAEAQRAADAQLAQSLADAASKDGGAG
ncbi:hypothetical protein [Streptomyces sp. NBC_01500]|nr:hypothetical protein [Streptomyces sp. NBC_01500]MCX4554259.1 hypothetical protein [Streptomyces sp. NBC_01500]